MRPVATDGAAWSVCVLAKLMYCTKTAEPTEMTFGRLTRANQRNHILDGDRDPSRGRAMFEGCPTH